MKIDKSNIHKYISGTELNCSSRDITSIEDIPDHITHLYFRYNKLTSLPKLPNSLMYLNCQYNKLTSLPKLPDSLTYLYCQYNKLNSYPITTEDKQWMDNHNNQLKLDNRIEIINKINSQPD